MTNRKFFESPSSVVGAPCFLADECKTDVLNRYENLNRSRGRRSTAHNDDKPLVSKNIKLEGDFTILNSKAAASDQQPQHQQQPQQQKTTPTTKSTPTKAPTKAPVETTTQPVTTSDALEQAVASAALIFFAGIFFQ